MKKLIARIRRFTKGVPFYRWPAKFFGRGSTRKKQKLRELRRFDRKKRVDFGGYIPAAALENTSVGGNAYEPSYPMPNLMRELGAAPGDRLLDIGCGKGYAMYCFSALPFSRIDGLEYVPALAETARKNLGKLFPGDARFHVYQGDAADWDGYDRYNFYYLYNPFREPVVQRVCDALLESQRRVPRALTIVYQAAFHGQLLAQRGFEPVWYGDGTIVYRRMPDAPGEAPMP